MKQPETLVGAFVAVGLTAAFVVSLGALPPPNDLSVEIDSPRSFVVVDNPQDALPGIWVGPPEALTRGLNPQNTPDRLHPGLTLRTWQLNYAERWQPEITVPVLTGPFLAEGSRVCGFSLKIGAEAFNTSTMATEVNRLVHGKLNQLFPRRFTHESGIEVDFPGLDSSAFKIELNDGRATLKLTVTLLDRTTINVETQVGLFSRDGVQIIRRTKEVEATWNGPARDRVNRQASARGATAGGVLGAFVGLFLFGPAGAVAGGALGAGAGSIAGEREAHEEGQKEAGVIIAKYVDEALGKISAELAKLKRPFAPLEGRPNDMVTLSVGVAPAISTNGIIVPFCMALRIGSPIDGSIVGPPNVLWRPENAADGTGSLAGEHDAVDHSGLELLADANGINQILYLLWQSGTLRKLGRSSTVLDALPESLRSLSFDIAGFDPGLPPTVTSSAAEGLTVVLGDVDIGMWETRRVVGHASTIVSLSESNDIEFKARFGEIHANCVERVASRTRFTPCLSDLLPAARDMSLQEGHTRRIPGGDVLARLPEVAFAGLKLELSNLRVSTVPKPTAALRIRVDAKVRPEP